MNVKEMRKFVLVIQLVLLCVSTSFAQGDTLKREIVNYLPEEDLTPRARLLLTDRLKAADRNKVDELQTFLVETENETHRNLLLQEKILLRYWLWQFRGLADFILQPPALDLLESDTTLILPPYDELYQVLLQEVVQQADYMKTVIQQNDSLEADEKAFLLLSLDFFMGEEQVTQQELNRKSEAFMDKHPESPYRQMVETNYYKVYQPSQWGLDFSIISGYHANSGKTSGLFDNGFAIGAGLGFEYKNWMLQTAISTCISRSKKDIPINQVTWERGHSSNIIQFESSLAYVINSQKRLSLIPFAGIGTTSINPMLPTVEDEEYYHGVAYRAKFTSYAGAGLRYKFPGKQGLDDWGPYTQGFTYLKLQYRYSHPQLDQGYSNLGGEMHLISLSFGGFIREMK